MQNNLYVSWGIHKEVEEAIRSESVCESCDIYRSSVLYCIKENRHIGMFHLCDNCMYDLLEWNYDHGGCDAEYCFVQKNL